MGIGVVVTQPDGALGIGIQVINVNLSSWIHTCIYHTRTHARASIGPKQFYSGLKKHTHSQVNQGDNIDASFEIKTKGKVDTKNLFISKSDDMGDVDLAVEEYMGGGILGLIEAIQLYDKFGAGVNF